jgi:type IV secretory pathway TrbF-like protein
VTLHEVNAASKGRARANRWRMYVLGAFVLGLFLTLATMLQIQQQNLKEYVHQQCLQRQINVTRANEIWAELGFIEQHNNFIDAKLRAERLQVYRNAHLDIPICT